jgi:hypothetical protein
LTAFAIDSEQRIDIAIGDRPPVRAPRQRGENLAGASFFVAAAGRTAGENPLPAWGLHGNRPTERP